MHTYSALLHAGYAEDVGRLVRECEKGSRIEMFMYDVGQTFSTAIAPLYVHKQPGMALMRVFIADGGRVQGHVQFE